MPLPTRKVTTVGSLIPCVHLLHFSSVAVSVAAGPGTFSVCASFLRRPPSALKRVGGCVCGGGRGWVHLLLRLQPRLAKLGWGVGERRKVFVGEGMGLAPAPLSLPWRQAGTGRRGGGPSAQPGPRAGGPTRRARPAARLPGAAPPASPGSPPGLRRARVG